MSKAVLAVIGAGQIGSRHLQALASLRREVDIYIVDPSDDASKTAYTRYLQAIQNFPEEITRKNVFLIHDISLLPSVIDVAIIATTAHNRLLVVETLLKKCTVKNLILEKIVFQRPGDFDRAGIIFAKGNVAAWVNCPRRFWSGYIEIKALIQQTQASSTVMMVNGARWGLCCNSIHFLDLYAYLTGQYNLDLRNDQLIPEILPTKRPDTIEMHGAIYGFTDSGGGIYLRDYNTSEIPVQIILENPDFRAVICEKDNFMMFSSAATMWEWRRIPLQPLMQSQLTHLYVSDILDHGKTLLPTFAESAVLHKCFLPPVMRKISEIRNEEVTLCPIT